MEPQFGTAALDEGECASPHRGKLRFKRLRRLNDRIDGPCVQHQ